MEKEKLTYKALLTVTESQATSPSDDAASYRHARLEVFCLRPNRSCNMVTVTAQSHRGRDNQTWSTWYATEIQSNPIRLDGTTMMIFDDPTILSKALERFSRRIYKAGATFDSGFDALLGYFKSMSCEPIRVTENYSRADFFNSTLPHEQLIVNKGESK